MKNMLTYLDKGVDDVVLVGGEVGEGGFCGAFVVEGGGGTEAKVCK